MIEADILIIGGGLTGLSLADQLCRARGDVHVLEARDRVGGRVLSVASSTADGAGCYDLGPSWFWPGQARMASLAKRFELTPFDQYASGLGCFQTPDGRVVKGEGYATMRGSWRVHGGMRRVIDGLNDALGVSRVARECAVASVHRIQAGTWRVEVRDKHERPLGRARRLVMALPPRLAAALDYVPALPEACIGALSATPTWMAGQAKMVVMYDAPFWREMGLSGDAMSQCGPLAEVHDATDEQTGRAALFGFVGTAAAQRVATDSLVEASLTQLASLFGEPARAASDVAFKDWAFDPYTSVAADRVPLAAHPEYGDPGNALDPWAGRLHFAATELATNFGGYLEGALDNAAFMSATLR